MQKLDPLLSGLYVLTDEDLLPQPKLWAAVEQALLGGIRLIQYRDKRSDARTRLRQAASLVELTAKFGAKLIINDDPHLALRVGAAGVHLGAQDINIAAARRLLGTEAIIGASCYASLNLAYKASQGGANYLAFGSVYSSPSKPNAPPAPLAILGNAKRFKLPVCAIGGINQHNIAAVARTGADIAAVLSAVFAQSDIRGACETLIALWQTNSASQ